MFLDVSIKHSIVFILTIYKEAPDTNISRSQTVIESLTVLGFTLCHCHKLFVELYYSSAKI